MWLVGLQHLGQKTDHHKGALRLGDVTGKTILFFKNYKEKGLAGHQ